LGLGPLVVADHESGPRSGLLSLGLNVVALNSMPVAASGELDCRVPYGNALERYAALQAQNVPSRLVIFPENRWVLHPQNAIHWHWEMQNWLARYIGGKPTLEKPTFKTDDAKPDDAKKEPTQPADL
jgi:hypothetical protein